MPFTRPTLQQITDRIEADYKSRIDGAQSFTRRSVLKVTSRVYGAAVYLLYGFLNYIKDQPFATTADSEFLEIIGSEFGISRKAATKATGTGTATGTVGKSIPIATRLSSNAGQYYLIDAEYTIPGAGSISVNFTAETAGDEGNDAGSVVLSYVTPIAGVDTTITATTAGISGGVDEESDNDFRGRILTRKRQPPHGGADFDYETWALEVSGVTRAWSFPQYMGHGTIGLAFVRDNDSTIIPNETEMATVRGYLEAHSDPLTGIEVGIPVTADPGFFMIDLSLLSVDFTIQLTPNTAAARADITLKLQDLILERGGPGETIYLSDVSAAISSSALEVAHRINSPLVDIGIAINRVPVLGTITWSTY